ncbi:Zinc finger C2H2 [Penicillium capsulatum]|uniref:Zinc finger C2H2 n=1 Tax=Penicillium capsulatum TaxID=69766 RepID=A0A9W9LLG6_9EURO|nr:Zinc finger C2H2 [Penicillium capsulatum]
MLAYPRQSFLIDPFKNEDHHELPEDYCLQPAFQYQQQQFASPPSTPSSPTFSSPTFSIPYPPSDCQSFGAPSMTPASSYNPSMDVDVQTSDSQSPYLSSQYPQYYTPMLAQQPIPGNQGWDSNLQLLSPARVPLPQKPSPGSASSRSVPSGNSAISPNSHRRSTSSTKPLPTPVQTPVQNSFLAAPFQNYDPSTHDVEAESAMRRAILDQQHKQQASPPQQQGDYSMATSVSSLSHNSPVTPQTNLDELDDGSKTMTNGENDYDLDQYMAENLHCEEYTNGNLIGIPKLNRTISDIYQDELYNPAIMAAPMTKSVNQNMLAPHNTIADRLQAANQGHMSVRSQSPAMSVKRERSPFRTNSPLAGDMNSTLQSQMNTSVPMPQDVAPPVNQGDLKTMSPKDAVLDFSESEDASMPLFPPQQTDFNLGDALGLRRDSVSSMPQRALTTMDAFPGQYATAPFTFAPQAQRPQQNLLQQQTPEFPIPLPRVDSNGSDLHPSVEITPQAKVPNPEGISRPGNTSSDAGTYTCTYHGCTLRFESPGKLQRHKREAHRQTTPGGHLITRDTTLRNSQAGPHKCERTNPSTGKPCNSVFSRPYDLTRHEDTIHNARKQKVHCHLCSEEKTFSRNDALTRHMRVVHPEVDWPGKQRRRGRD